MFIVVDVGTGFYSIYLSGLDKRKPGLLLDVSLHNRSLS
jgi:hypothetical protein